MAWTLPLLCFFSSLLSIAFGQTSEAVCLPYYSWTTNSQGKTPCELAASLLAVCSDEGKFNVLPLPLGQHYQGPTLVSNANPCTCNTVIFSLMSACGLCQGRSVIRWSEWSANCPQVTLQDFPSQLPDDLRVPGWAYQDVKTSDVFDQFLAKDSSNATEFSAIPVTLSPTTTLASTPAEASSTVAEITTTSVPDAEVEEEKGKISYANRVGGSVVGSLLGTALIVGIIVFVVYRRRARRNRAGEQLGSDRDTASELERQPEQMRERE